MFLLQTELRRSIRQANFQHLLPSTARRRHPRFPPTQEDRKSLRLHPLLLPPHKARSRLLAPILMKSPWRRLRMKARSRPSSKDGRNPPSCTLIPLLTPTTQRATRTLHLITHPAVSMGKTDAHFRLPASAHSLLFLGTLKVQRWTKQWQRLFRTTLLKLIPTRRKSTGIVEPTDVRRKDIVGATLELTLLLGRS